jgi:hypothetical protein
MSQQQVAYVVSQELVKVATLLYAHVILTENILQVLQLAAC